MSAVWDIALIAVGLCVVVAVGYVAIKIVRGCMQQGCLTAVVIIAGAAIVIYLLRDVAPIPFL